MKIGSSSISVPSKLGALAPAKTGKTETADKNASTKAIDGFDGIAPKTDFAKSPRKRVQTRAATQAALRAQERKARKKRGIFNGGVVAALALTTIFSAVTPAFGNQISTELTRNTVTTSQVMGPRKGFDALSIRMPSVFDALERGESVTYNGFQMSIGSTEVETKYAITDFLPAADDPFWESFPTYQTIVVQRGDSITKLLKDRGVEATQENISRFVSDNKEEWTSRGVKPNAGTLFPKMEFKLSSSLGAREVAAPQVAQKSTALARALRVLAPRLTKAKANDLAPHLQAAMDYAEINTPKRRAAFLAQISHESGGFHFFEEIASGKAYNGRKDLGNRRGTQDGVRYKGRGLIQLTGRYNYRIAGEELGLDLLKNPELAAEPANAAMIAAWFWKTKDLNSHADAGRFSRITERINGGQNGRADRTRLYRVALRAKI